MDAPDSTVQGAWYELSRAVDQYGQPLALRLPEPRATEAALRFLQKALRRHGLPAMRPLDGSDAHEAAIKRDNEEHGTARAIRQGKYCHHIVEHDPRAVQRVTRPMRGVKAFEAAQDTLGGIALMPMLQQRQMVVEAGDEGHTAAAVCDALAA